MVNPVESTRARRGRALASWALIGVGGVLVAVYLAGWLHAAVGSRLAAWSFDAERRAPPRDASQSPQRPSPLPADETVDFRLWDDVRIRGYKESLQHAFGTPLAVLRIPKIDVKVPVLEGTSDLALNRGVGWIEGTPRPGEAGNVGIAGHRDGFFRGLKDIAIGDRLVLDLPGETVTYVIDETRVVAPEDVFVLAPRPSPSLTLVTCYPFYYVGFAPQRFIVHAKREGTAPRSKQP